MRLPANIDLANMGANGEAVYGSKAEGIYGIGKGSVVGDINADGKLDLIIGSPDAFAIAGNYTTARAGRVYVLYGKTTLPKSLDLETLTAGNGVVIKGAASSEAIGGTGTILVGDLNGDGISDLVLGAPEASPYSRYEAGRVYVVYGKRTLPASINLNNLPTTSGFVVNGAVAGDLLGTDISPYAISDVNGDGKKDLILGAPSADALGRTRAGQIYVIYGKSTYPAIIDLKSLTSVNGLLINGAAYNNNIGFADRILVSDINNDKIKDLIIGAPLAVPPDGLSSGIVYCIYGKKTFPASLDLANLKSTDALLITNNDNGQGLGNSGAVLLDDINRDGITDIIVGMPQNYLPFHSFNGQVSVIYGKNSFPAIIDLDSITASDGINIFGKDSSKIGSANSMSIADVNGDGYKDLILGGPLAYSWQGMVSVIYGKSSLPAMLDLNNLPAANGMMINGTAPWSTLGTNNIAADINGDGIKDMILAAPDANGLGRQGSGQVYVVYGKKSLPAVIDLNTMTALNGITITGPAAENYVGDIGQVFTGDIDGDGIQDIVLGVPEADPLNRADAGIVYVIYGSSKLPQSIDLNTLSASYGSKIVGGRADAEIGKTGKILIADITGDGLKEIILGDYKASPLNRSSAGEVFVVKASKAPSSSPSTTRSKSRTKSASKTRSKSRTKSASKTRSKSLSKTRSKTASKTATKTRTKSLTKTHSLTASRTPTRTRSTSLSSSISTSANNMLFKRELPEASVNTYKPVANLPLTTNEQNYSQKQPIARNIAAHQETVPAASNLALGMVLGKLAADAFEAGKRWWYSETETSLVAKVTPQGQKQSLLALEALKEQVQTLLGQKELDKWNRYSLEDLMDELGDADINQLSLEQVEEWQADLQAIEDGQAEAEEETALPKNHNQKRRNSFFKPQQQPATIPEQAALPQPQQRIAA